MVDDEGEVGEVAGGALQVAGVELFEVLGAERVALVELEDADAEVAGAL